jgi:DNA-binding NarL/FixJ family response regulator
MDACHWGQSRFIGSAVTALIDSKTPAVGVLSSCWDELCRGHASIEREYSDEAGHHAELAWGPTRGPGALELEMLTRVVLGELQKVVALSEARSASSVATLAAAALRNLGLRCRPRETPLIIVMMAQAWHQGVSGWAPVDCRLVSLDARVSLLSVSRPDGWLNGVLSPCERKVLRARVNGLSHDNVARVFDVSRRTVANQIASGYKKLGVSGRLELLNRVLVPCQRIEAPPRRETVQPPARVRALGSDLRRPAPPL